VLALVAGLAFLVEPVISQLVRAHLPAPLIDNPTPDTLLQHPGHLALTILLTGYYPALAWIGYLAVGLLVGRLDLRSPRVAFTLLGAGTALAALTWELSWILLGPLGGRARLLATPTVLPGVGPIQSDYVAQRLTAGLYGTTPTDSWWWLAVRSPHSSTPLDLLHTTGTSLALLGFALLIARLGIAGRALLWPLAAVGSMTLTWYTLHAGLLSTTGVLPTDPMRSYLAQVAVALAVASAWRATGWRGPLEALIAMLARLSIPSARGRPPGDPRSTA
jgi:hypothetical protein